MYKICRAFSWFLCCTVGCSVIKLFQLAIAIKNLKWATHHFQTFLIPKQKRPCCRPIKKNSSILPLVVFNIENRPQRNALWARFRKRLALFKFEFKRSIQRKSKGTIKMTARWNCTDLSCSAILGTCTRSALHDMTVSKAQSQRVQVNESAKSTPQPPNQLTFSPWCKGSIQTSVFPTALVLKIGISKLFGLW